MKILGNKSIGKAINRFNQKGIILMYHRIGQLEHDPWQLNVTPENFNSHMQVLKKYGCPVSLREMGKKIKRFSFGQKEIAVTFDDGYSDNYRHAQPILKKHEIPATFFIVSGAVDSKEEFWWDELERLTLGAKTLPGEFILTITHKEYQWPISKTALSKSVAGIPNNGTPLSRSQLHAILWRILSQLSSQEKRNALKQIASWAEIGEISRTDYLPMTSTELKSLADSALFEIGAHTALHSVLPSLSNEEQKKEIGDSKYALEKTINKKVDTFSYPHGEHSDITVGLVKNLGFHCACTVEKLPVVRTSDVFRLPRFKVLNWTINEFEQKLTTWMEQ